MDKKGGVMKKVLALLVVFCFIFSNACFAMPSVSISTAGTSNECVKQSSQDNMDLATHIDANNLRTPDAQQKLLKVSSAIAAYIKAKYSGQEVPAFMQTWLDNEQKAQAALGTTGLTPEVSETVAGLLGKNLVAYGKDTDSLKVVAKNPQTGEPVFGFVVARDTGKISGDVIEDKTVLQNMIVASMSEIGDAKTTSFNFEELSEVQELGIRVYLHQKAMATFEAATEAELMPVLQSLLQRAQNEGTAQDVAQVQELISKLQNGLLGWIDEQVIDNEKFKYGVHDADGRVGLSKVYRAGGSQEQHLAQALKHEVQEEPKSGDHRANIDSETLFTPEEKEQFKNDLRAEINAKAAADAAQQLREQLAFNPQDIGGNAALTDQQIVKVVASKVKSQQGIIDLLSRRTAEIEKANQVANQLEQGIKGLGYSANSFFRKMVNEKDTSDVRFVSTYIAAPIKAVLRSANVKAGAFTLYGFANQAEVDLAKKSLEADGIDTAKVNFIIGKNLTDLAKNTKELSIVYVEGEISQAERISGVFYVEVPQNALTSVVWQNSSIFNGLDVFLVATTRSLDNLSQEARDLLTKNGVVSAEFVKIVPTMAVTDEAEYQELKSGYEVDVVMSLQA